MACFVEPTPGRCAGCAPVQRRALPDESKPLADYPSSIWSKRPPRFQTGGTVSFTTVEEDLKALLSSAVSGTGDDLKQWMSEAFEKQQAALQQVLSLQHEQLASSLDEKLAKLPALQDSFANRPLLGNGVTSAFNSTATSEYRTMKTQFGKGTGSERSQLPQKEDFEEACRGTSSPEVAPEKVPPASEKPAGQGSGCIIAKHSSKNFSLNSMRSFLHQVVSSKYFDMGVGTVIVANMCCMFVQLEWEGNQVARERGYGDETGSWRGAAFAFTVAEELFNAFFLAELLVRVWTYRMKFFHDVANWFDACIVLSSSVDAYVLRPLAQSNGFSVGGLIKVFRVIRVLRILRLLTKFSELRILMRAIAESAQTFLWSMLLATVLICAGGIFMAQISREYIVDDSFDDDFRYWVYRHYGSATKATYSMFEATFSGGWPALARPLIENANGLFTLFWASYILLIHFAMVRVIAALFLKQTMQVAANDKDKTVLEKLRMKERFQENLKKFFRAADSSEDGMLSRHEVDSILSLPDVKTLLLDAELSVHEVSGIFNLLEENGEVAATDFVKGAIRLKRSGIDAVTLMHEQEIVRERIGEVAEGISILFQHLGVETPFSLMPINTRTKIRDQSMESYEDDQPVDYGAM